MSSLRSRVPLRITLVAALLLLVALALTLSGIATTATLRHHLVSRVDGQLAGAAHQMQEYGMGDLRPEAGAEPDGDEARVDRGEEAEEGPLPSAFVAEVTDAQGRSVYGPRSNLLDEEPLPDLPAAPPADEARTFTVPSVAGSTQWRVRAVPVDLVGGDRGTLLVAQSLDDVEHTVDQLLLLLLVIGAGAVVVLGGVGYLLVRASLRPLEDVERTAARIAAGDLSQRVPQTDTRTEVGRLALALNAMLGQIESAFRHQAASEEEARSSEERMRRFVADASHELRTPLTSIRGFAELYRQGAVPSAETGTVMRRIEDEAARMGLLVDDLLLLARLDQERPLAKDAVDVLTIAADAVAAARAVQPRRPIALEVGELAVQPVVTGDPARLRQVLDNLVGNALQHTSAGTAVTVRVSSDRTAVALEVADEGLGMDPEHAARVFERFYRADPSRARADGGAGLGLSIADSLVRAHGGGLELDTGPGQGACFRVRLPVRAESALVR